MQRSDPSFLPGKISTGKYEQRSDQSTKQQLSLLLTSPEYLQWQAQQQQASQDGSGNRHSSSMRKVSLAVLSILFVSLAAAAPYYLPRVKQQVSPAAVEVQACNQHSSPEQQHHAGAEHANSPLLSQESEPSAHQSDNFVDAKTAAGQQQLIDLLNTLSGSNQEASQKLQPAYDSAALDSPPWELAQETEGPHPWFGDMQMVYPSAISGLLAIVAVIVGLVVQWRHMQTISELQQRIQRLRFRLAEALSAKELGSDAVKDLQQQLESIQEVQKQLETANQALQGKQELHGQEVEVLQMELLAKDKALALRQALADSEGDAESADIHEGSPNQGMLTPPQPAPPASTADAGSEAEMSFRDLIDDDSDEEAKTHAEDVNNYEKALLASGQVLVDPEDLQNWADMDKEYQAVQAECVELQSLLDQKDDQLCSLNQDLMDLTRRMKGELSSKDETVKELRRWLDQAQGQLQNTQAALHEREADCKTLAADLKAALADLAALKEKAASGVEGDAQLAVTVLRQDMQERSDALEASRDQLRLRDEEVQDLAQHLRAAQADIASLQAQLKAAEAREGALVRETEDQKGMMAVQVDTLMHTVRGLRHRFFDVHERRISSPPQMQDLVAQDSYADDLDRRSEANPSQLTGPSLMSGSFEAFTPNSTLVVTASGLDAPASETGSVAGPLPLTPVRRMQLTPQGAFEVTPEAVTATSATPESLGGSVGGPLVLTPSSMPARLPSLEPSAAADDDRDCAEDRAAGLAHKGAGTSGQAAQLGRQEDEEERENVPPYGTPPSVRKAQAVKQVRDTYMRLGRWNLAAFLQEMGCTTNPSPVTQVDFDRVKDNGLRALHPSNQGGKSEAQKAAAAEARAIVEGWLWPVPKVCLKPASPYWFAR